MKVLFWVDSFPSFSETFIRDQIVSLIEEGVDVLIHSNTAFNTSENDALNNVKSYRLEERVVGLDTYFEANKVKRLFKVLKIILSVIGTKNRKYYLEALKAKEYGDIAKSMRLLFRTHFILNQNIDIIHAHFGTNAKDAVIFKKMGLSIKLVTTFHGYDIRLGLVNGISFYEELFQYVDVVFSISDYNYRSLLSLGADKNKMVTLNNGIDSAYYKKESFDSNFELLKFLTVARLVEEKALHIAIEAISKLKQARPNLKFQYTIIGEGEKRKELQNIIDDLNVSKEVKLVGAKNSNDVRQYMINSHIFLLPSKVEALPTVLLEAQSSQLLVVATDVGSVKSVVRSGKVVLPLDVEAFYNAILFLIDNKNKWNDFVEKGRAHVKKNYDIGAITKALVDIYEKI